MICKNGAAIRPTSVVGGAQAVGTETTDFQIKVKPRSNRMDADFIIHSAIIYKS